MAYLYGNSEPFPAGYDFITALDAFVANAAQALPIATRARHLVEAHEKEKSEREEVFAALEAFHATTAETLDRQLKESSSPLVLEYLRGLGECSAVLVRKFREVDAAAAAQEEQKHRGELAACRAELRAAIGGSLVRLDLPVERTTFTLRLVNGRPELGARVVHPRGLVVDYAIATSARPEWQAPRRVLDFVSGLNLPFDVKKGWFTPSIQQQFVPVAEFLIGGFVIDEKQIELRLRRKSTDDDLVVIDLRRDAEGELSIALRRPGEAEETASRSEVDATTRKLLGDLWDALRRSCVELMAGRGQVLAATFDGRDVIEAGQVAPMIRAVVEMIAPIVEEIDRRSPNHGELSLKHEHETGRREEIYAKKDVLAGKLAGLSPDEASLFSPLGLVVAPAA